MYIYIYTKHVDSLWCHTILRARLSTSFNCKVKNGDDGNYLGSDTLAVVGFGLDPGQVDAVRLLNAWDQGTTCNLPAPQISFDGEEVGIDVTRPAWLLRPLTSDGCRAHCRSVLWTRSISRWLGQAPQNHVGTISKTALSHLSHFDCLEQSAKRCRKHAECCLSLFDGWNFPFILWGSWVEVHKDVW